MFFMTVDQFTLLLCQALGESKIASMMESKDFRKGIVQLEWEHKKNLMRIEDLKNKMKIINMMKVTRQIQSYLNEEDHDAKVSQEVSILEQTILMQKRVSRFNTHYFTIYTISLYTLFHCIHYLTAYTILLYKYTISPHTLFHCIHYLTVQIISLYTLFHCIHYFTVYTISFLQFAF